ncbi:hypothetical protein C241_15748 [Bradyrhizobium lupini HPC(L)]|uniref:Uncharacterized protein n=1 Tax=Bradyrhizobium lupini HPC(L) TaxID=1229491 RepID=A0ABP2RRT7_RHILU|nr:hypothetical protein C241_15748 [Bradyrhizobium lupini HPC(L)]
MFTLNTMLSFTMEEPNALSGYEPATLRRFWVSTIFLSCCEIFPTEFSVRESKAPAFKLVRPVPAKRAARWTMVFVVKGVKTQEALEGC